MRLAIVLMLASSLASADPDDRGPGWDGGIVHLAGRFPIGSQSNFVLGTRLEAGGHYGPISLLGEYTFYNFESSSGTMVSIADIAHRIGATARVRFGGAGPDYRYSYGWLELGAGEQLYGVAARHSRPDLAAGAGWQMSWRNIRDVQVGFFLAVRATQATAPSDPTAPYMPAGASPACHGSCQTMVPAAGIDRSILFTAGVVFGS
jgi:hypothetical protein